MSENWGADFIPRGASGRGKLVEALSVAQHLPFEAMDEAAQRPQAVAEEVLRVAERAASGETLTDREQNLLFWGMHVLAQVRDTRLFGPLIRLLRLPGEAPIELLADALQTTLPNVVASVFDGDAQALEDAISDRDADEIVRWGLFAAYAYLVFEGRIDRERARSLLTRFDDDRLARSGDAAWAGWEETIALLGFGDLASRRSAALADARLLADEEEDGFATMLSRAEAQPSDPSRFAERGLGYVEDAAAELDEALASDEEPEPGEPVHNPLRDVGRNDPCPCGSGKKFKKCCLGKAPASEGEGSGRAG